MSGILFKNLRTRMRVLSRLFPAFAYRHSRTFLRMTHPRIELIRNMLDSIATGNVDAVAAAIDETNYIQHNPQTHEGSEGLAVLFQKLSQTNPTVNMVRGFYDGDYVFAHMEYKFRQPKVCFEVFRFGSEGRAVEHWDNLQIQSASPNASGRFMTDGTTTGDKTSSKTESTRTIVRDFLQTVLVQQHVDQCDTFIDTNLYAEHNPELSDNLDELKQRIQNKFIDYRVVHRILCQDNFGLSVTEGFRNGVHTSFYDLFRVEHEKIVEHWDTTETVVPQSEWKNTNGKF